MEFHMISISYAAMHVRAETEKTTFSCKDDCTLTKHTWRWTYSALRYFFVKIFALAWAFFGVCVQIFASCVCVSVQIIILFGIQLLSNELMFKISRSDHSLWRYLQNNTDVFQSLISSIMHLPSLQRLHIWIFGQNVCILWTQRHLHEKKTRILSKREWKVCLIELHSFLPKNA